MIGIVATINIQEGKNAEFEAVANQLVEKVNTNEEGAEYYDLYKQDATTYVFLERYTDEAALAIHQKTNYGRRQVAYTYARAYAIGFGRRRKTLVHKGQQALARCPSPLKISGIYEKMKLTTPLTPPPSPRPMHQSSTSHRHIILFLYP